MNPAELAAALLDVVRATAARRELDRPRSRRKTSPSSAPATATTATGRRTSRSSSASGSASTRAGSPPSSPSALGGGRRHRVAPRSPAPASSTSAWMPRPRVLLAQTIVEQGDAYGRGPSTTASRSTSSSSRRTRPARSTSAARAGPRSATASRACFQAQGGVVTREYYFNDHGVQIDRFARSLVAAHLGEPAPEDGYGGAYILDIAARGRGRLSRRRCALALPRDEAQEVVPRARREPDVRRDQGEPARLRRRLRRLLPREHAARIGRGRARRSPRLRELGHIFEADGATWLRTTEFGDDKDRVIIKNDGEAAYISGDLAYYLDKRERGFERNIILLGADHHGYVQRLMAMTAAFGDVPYVNLEILIGQLVNLVKDGEPVRMSKRAGTVVTMEDLVDAVGVDAARYALVRSSTDSSLDIDLDLLHASAPTTTRSSTCSTRTPAPAPSRATPRHPGVDRSVVRRVELLDARDRERAARRARRVPAHRRCRRPSCASRTASPATSKSSPARTTAGTTPAASSRSATAPIEDVHRTRLWLNDATGSGAAQRTRPAGRQRPRQDVADRGRDEGREAEPTTKPIPVVEPADTRRSRLPSAGARGRRVRPEEEAPPLAVRAGRHPARAGDPARHRFFIGGACAKNYARDYIKQRIVAVARHRGPRRR